jgi:hypothetical protein
VGLASQRVLAQKARSALGNIVLQYLLLNELQSESFWHHYFGIVQLLSELPPQRVLQLFSNVRDKLYLIRYILWQINGFQVSPLSFLIEPGRAKEQHILGEQFHQNLHLEATV